MDAEFWSSRVTAARRQSALQADQYFCLDDLDGGEGRVDFLCPYCYVEYDIVSLCSHLEDDHGCESTNAACPVCAASVGSDIVGHITSQHCHLFKIQRRRRYLRGRTLSNSSGSKEQRLRSLLTGTTLPLAASNNDAPDPLISSFISGLPILQTPEIVKHDSSLDNSSERTSEDHTVQSANEIVANEESKEKIEEVFRRAEFVQQLVLSVFLPDEV